MKKFQKFGVLAIALLLTVTTGVVLAYTFQGSAPGMGTYDNCDITIHVADVELVPIGGVFVTCEIQEKDSVSQEWVTKREVYGTTNNSGYADMDTTYICPKGIPHGTMLRFRVSSLSKPDWDGINIPSAWDTSWSDLGDNASGGDWLFNSMDVMMGYGG